MDFMNRRDDDDVGLNMVQMQKDKLLAKVRENRAKHEEAFTLAMKGYRARMLETIEAMLVRAQASKDVAHTIALVRPESHLKDYDAVIDQLENEERAVLSLNAFGSAAGAAPASFTAAMGVGPGGGGVQV